MESLDNHFLQREDSDGNQEKNIQD
jgi:hypothetical protein